MSPMNRKASTISVIMVVCLALAAIMKDQVEQLNKIRVAATAVGIDKQAVKKCLQSARLCVNAEHLLFCSGYIDLSLCRVQHHCDLSCGVYTLFRLINFYGSF